MNGRKLIWIIVAILFICLVVRLVMLFRQAEVVQPPPEPPAPPTAEELMKIMLEERKADTNYVANLEALAARRQELAALRGEASREFERWRDGFIATNGEAKAVFDEIRGLDMSAEGAETNRNELAARLEALVAADPDGARHLDKRDKIEKAIAEHQDVITAYISSYVRRQAQAHVSDEAARVAYDRKRLVESGEYVHPTNRAPRAVAPQAAP